VVNALNYAAAGPFTDLAGVPAPVLGGVPDAVIDICQLAHSLVIHPHDVQEAGVPAERLAESQLRPASSIIAALLAQGAEGLTVPRPPERRVVGTCRHFTVLTCALLRYCGIAARARCGFATYFQAGKGVDHWITEYWQAGEGRWVRVDSEFLGGSQVPNAEDLRPGAFLTGGEAWTAHREGRINAGEFGVHGTENWGPAEIRGNAIRDLAALNKLEMLPWDEWGRMTASYKGETGADYDELIDDVAAACATGDAATVAGLYGTDELRVPDTLIS
jgi:Transglutaminase-like superfamily